VPLYLVRWPGLLAALVNAADEDNLLDILDETANPEGCTWSLYRGPLYVEFAVNAELTLDDAATARDRPLDPSELRVGNVSPICERDVLRAVLDLNSDTAAAMVDQILEKAFPTLYPVLTRDRGDADAELPEDEVRAAVRSELDVLIRASWQQQQTKRRPDDDSRTAAMMGTASLVIAHWNRSAAALNARQTAPKKTRAPKKRPAPKPRGKGSGKKRGR
jgi:hypothetical protein